MLSTTSNFGWSTSAADESRDQRWGWVALAVYLGFTWLWAFSVDAPWDDDCPTRFFNTQNAFRHPENLVSVWNRPLFVWIFALPAQLGNWTVPLLMGLISSLGAFALWRGLRHIQVPNAWLAIPLLLFQPFFFGTSRVALTEPLAAVLICAGFYYYQRQRWLLFALMGGLLPLARLELAPLLLIWAWPILRERRWASLALLALPVFVWNLLAGIITGDFLYLWTQTFGLDTGKNRYGHTDFFHYFRRSMWVTGPVVFMLFIHGLVARIRHKRILPWLDGQLWLGLLLYVFFSWKLSLGNAAGFLRNLVPLAPLVALIALEGFNFALQAILNRQDKNERLYLGISVATSLLLCWAYFSTYLSVHQVITPYPNYVAIICLGAAVVWLGSQLFIKVTDSGATATRLSLGTALIVMAYALWSEPPAASHNNERQAIGIVADYYDHHGLQERPTLANHNWFFWRIGENPADPSFGRVTMANMEAAPVGSIIVWDMHYATRLDGDVLPQYLYNHPEYVELLQIGFPNRMEAVYLLEKSSSDPKDQEQRSTKFYSENADFLPALTARAFRLMYDARHAEALQLFDRALGQVRNDPDLWYGQGYCLLHLGRMPEARQSLNNAVNLWPDFPVAWYNLGRAHAAVGDMQSAIDAMNRGIQLGEVGSEVYFSRGTVFASMRDFQHAIADFGKALELDPKHYQALMNRAAAFAMLQQFDSALADLKAAQALKPGDPEGIFVEGRILHSMGKTEEGCQRMQQAVQLGLAKAKEFVDKTCLKN